MSSLDPWATYSVLDVSIKAALLVLAAWTATVCLGVRNANAKHRTWLMALAGMLLLPLLVNLAPRVPLPNWMAPTLPGIVANKLPSPPEETNDERAVATAPAFTENREVSRVESPAVVPKQTLEKFPAQEPLPFPHRPLAAPPENVAAHSPTVTAASDPGEHPWAAALVFAYATGALFLLARLLVGMIKTFQLIHRSHPVASPAVAQWLPAWARAAESIEIRVPVTIGYWRPTVLLPADWRNWSDSFTETVLAHEAAHIRRRDTWVMLLAAINCAIYWFHPGSWLVRRRLGELAEQVCDDEVIRVLEDRTEYARNLIEIAGRLSTGRGRLRPVGVAMASRPNVEKRIEAILDPDRPLASRLRTPQALLLAVVAATIVVLAAGLQLADRAAAEEPAPTATVRQNDAERDGPEPAASQTGLKGRVIMAGTGAPVPSAEVRLLTWPPNATSYKSTTAVTNEEGEFAFDELGEGKHRLAAYYEELASRSKRYKGKEAEAGEESIVLELHKAPALKVSVVSRANNKPIEGATVRLTWTDTDRDHLTDANGDVTIRGLTPEVWTIEVRAKGHAEQEHAVNLTGTDIAEITAELDPGVELFGTVQDEAGKALADVGISVFPSDRRGSQIEYMKTDAEGRYRFKYLPIAGLTLNISKDDYLRRQSDVSITVPPGGQQELNLTLARRPDGGSVKGVIVDTDGNPIEGATLTNRGMSSRELRETTSDADGAYRLDDVFEGSVSHEVIVKAKGFAPQRLAFDPGSRAEPAELDITLSPGHRIRGRVMNERGEGVSDVAVYSHGTRYPDSELGERTTTDHDGRFALDSLPAESPFAFKKKGYSDMNDLKLPVDGEDEVVVTLKPHGIIRGRVIDAETGEPISPFMVRITFSPDRRADDPKAGLSGARVTTGEKFDTPDGSFELDDFVLGMPLQVTVEAEGYSRQVLRRAVAMAEAEAKSLELRLMPEDSESLIRFAGRLVGEQDRPIVGAELRLIVASKRSLPRDRFPFNWAMIRSGQVESSDVVLQFLATTTDRQGRFVFERVQPAQDIEIAYWGEGVSQDRIANLAELSDDSRDDFTIPIETPATIRGIIDVDAFPDISDIMVSTGGDFHRAEISPQKDAYEIRNVPPGWHQLQVYGPSARVDQGGGGFTRDVIQRFSLDAKSGETVTLDIVAEPASESPPVPEQDSGAAGESLTTDEPVAAVRPESGARGDVQAGGEAGSAKGDAVADADGTEITIDGTVNDETGEAIGEATLWLSIGPTKERIVEGTTNAEGKFTLRVPAAWVKPGRYSLGRTVWCHAPGHQIASASVYAQLMRGATEPISFALKPATDTGFTITDPDGQPVVGATVAPELVLTPVAYERVPKPLRNVVGDVTDEKGRAMLPALGREVLFAVQVIAEGYGAQELRLENSAEEPAIRNITLRATGRLEGRLVSSDPEIIGAVRMGVYQEDFLGRRTSGQAPIEVDAEGRFVVSHFAEGPIRLIMVIDTPPDADIPLRPRIPGNLEINAGQTTTVEVPFEPTVRVRGRVQTKGDVGPVGGARVAVQYGSFRQSESVRADADGRFEANVLPGPVRQQVISRPKTFSDWRQEGAGRQTPVTVPADAEIFDLPPIELIQTTSIQ